MSPFKQKPKCPNCHEGLETKPKRKKKCPHCGEFIFVRKGILLTQEEAKIEDWLIRLDMFGIGRIDFNNHRMALSKQFAAHASVRDTIWRILNLIVMSDDLFNRRQAYYEMARIVEEEGKDARPLIENALKTQLVEYKSKGYSKVRVVSYVNDNFVCEKCRYMNGMELSIEEAIMNMPIPRQCVSEHGCRCQYELSDPFENLGDI